MVIGALLSRVGSDCTVFDSKVDIWVERAEFYGQADVSVVCGRSTSTRCRATTRRSPKRSPTRT
jgi:hypothetical protein